MIRASLHEKSKKIALVITSLAPVGGVETLNLMLADRFLLLGYDVDIVLAWEDAPTPELVPDNARVINFGVSRLREFVQPFKRYLQAEKPDAVLVSMWPLTVWSILAHLLGTSKSRLLVSDHNPLSRQYADWGLAHRLFLRFSLAAAYRFADARIGVSSGVADDVAALSGVDRKRFTVIHNPLTLPDVRNSSDTSAAPEWMAQSGRRILTVGRLKPQKNHRLLLRAFARLLKREKAHLLILGVGELGDELVACIGELGIGSNVSMPGLVADPTPYYQAADLFVLSSDYEGFGNVVVEALACGTPVVSTNCPSGPAEILANGQFGTLVPCGDEDALADAMFHTLASPSDPEVLKQRASLFSIENVADKYLRLLFPA